MTDRYFRTAWLAGLTATMVVPPLLWLATTAPEPMWSRLAVITGLFALSAMVCAAVLPSRLRSVNRAFGIEGVIEVHRFLGIGAAAMVLLHLACVVAADPTAVALLDIARAPARAQAASAATVALGALVAAALLRRHLRLPYEIWRWTHIALGGAAVVFSALHVVLLDHAVAQASMAVALTALLLVLVAVAAYRWVWRGLLDPSTEFVVHEVRAESPTVSTLVLGPRARHLGGRRPEAANWAFAPGQFAWLRLVRSPAAEEHPFTIASSAHLGRTEFTIRHGGDFTRRLRTLPPGSPVWVDGPHGAFTSDIGTCEGFVLVAGGVGITPMMSMLRTAADRADPRPYRLVVVAGAPEDLLFREELGFLRSCLDLEVTEVLRRPREGWYGHTGDLGVSLLTMVLGTVARPDRVDWFLCGPPGLVDDALDVLDVLDVAPTRIRTELFDFV
jgi:3-phenylpropionate/trans-cinnamate dioxygenase ferredoxin reductase subunit